MPQQALRGFGDQGEVARTLDANSEAARRTLAGARAAGIDLAAMTAELEGDGVRSFCDSHRQLLDSIEKRLDVGTAADRRQRRVIASDDASSPTGLEVGLTAHRL